MAKLTKYCTDNKKWFYKLKIKEFQKFSNKFKNDVFEILKQENILKNHKTIGSTNAEMVKKFIAKYKKIYQFEL